MGELHTADGDRNGPPLQRGAEDEARKLQHELHELYSRLDRIRALSAADNQYSDDIERAVRELVAEEATARSELCEIRDLFREFGYNDPEESVKDTVARFIHNHKEAARERAEPRQRLRQGLARYGVHDCDALSDKALQLLDNQDVRRREAEQESSTNLEDVYALRARIQCLADAMCKQPGWYDGADPVRFAIDGLRDERRECA